MMEVHSLADSLHCVVGRSLRDITYFVERLEQQHPSGFSPNTLPAIWLKNDYTALLDLAMRIDVLRHNLTEKAA